jgi:hypothetical protein
MPATSAGMTRLGRTDPLIPVRFLSVNPIVEVHGRRRRSNSSTGALLRRRRIPAPMVLHKAASIRAREIEQRDLARVARLLAEGFPRRPRRFWSDVLAQLARRPSDPGLPKFGYLLDADRAVVGAIITIFSRIEDGAHRRTRCSVSSWFVKPGFRSYASLLVSKALSRKDVTYLNITPAPHTVPIVRAQGYSRYNEGIFVAAPALQMSAARVRIVSAQEHCLPQEADPFEQGLLSEHARFGCMSFWCRTSDGCVPFVFRRRRLRGVPGFAQLVYCREVGDFVRFAGPIGRFLFSCGCPLVLVDTNGPIPGLAGKYFPARMLKYFKGPDRPRFGDLAYTETAMFGF